MNSDRLEGIFKGRGIAGSQQFKSENGTDTMKIDLDLQTPTGVRRLSTFLYLSPKAIQYSVERLRALGWDGSSILDAVGIGQNEVNVQVRYEMYKDKEQMRVEIMAGGGRIEFEPMAPDAKRQLAARVAALMGDAPKPAASPAVANGDFPFGANEPNPKAGL